MKRNTIIFIIAAIAVFTGSGTLLARSDRGGSDSRGAPRQSGGGSSRGSFGGGSVRQSASRGSFDGGSVRQSASRGSFDGGSARQSVSRGSFSGGSVRQSAPRAIQQEPRVIQQPQVIRQSQRSVDSDSGRQSIRTEPRVINQPIRTVDRPRTIQQPRTVYQPRQSPAERGTSTSRESPVRTSPLYTPRRSIGSGSDSGRSIQPNSPASPVSRRTSDPRISPLRRLQTEDRGTFGGLRNPPAGGRTSEPRISPLRRERGDSDSQPGFRPEQPGRPGGGIGGSRPGDFNCDNGRPDFGSHDDWPDSPRRHRRPPRRGLPFYYNPWICSNGLWGTDWGWSNGCVYYDTWRDDGWYCSSSYYSGWRGGWYSGRSCFYDPWPTYGSVYFESTPVYVEPAPVYIAQAPATIVQQPVIVQTAPVEGVQQETAIAQQPYEAETFPIAQRGDAQVVPQPVAQPALAAEARATGCAQDGALAGGEGAAYGASAYPDGAEYAITAESTDLSLWFQSYAETLDPERIWDSYNGLDRE